MIIEVVGKEIEKIKGNFETYLSGLNMVGEISYSQYSELYDEGTKQIQKAYELGKSELEKENAELEKSCDETQKLLDRQIEATYKLDKENADLKDCFKIAKDNEYEYQSLFTKAKELLKEFMSLLQNPRTALDTKTVMNKADQFLKASEVEK